MRPLIGISCDYDANEPQHIWLREEYARAVRDSGGQPLLLPPLAEDLPGPELRPLAGLVISGGDFDLEPAYYGEEPHPGLGKLNPRRSRAELALVKWAFAEGRPLLGICNGLQTINVASGGTLYQDIPSQAPSPVPHQRPRPQTAHPVKITSRTLLFDIIGVEEVMVNSTHHQAVKELGEGLVNCAVAPDGIVEAAFHRDHPFMLGLQWHPEALYEGERIWLEPYRALVRAASRCAP